jgi:hypothetical protein
MKEFGVGPISIGNVQRESRNTNVSRIPPRRATSRDTMQRCATHGQFFNVDIAFIISSVP